MTVIDWKQEAIELAKTGKSWRKISELLDKPRSTVSDYLRKEFKGLQAQQVTKEKGPRILFIDIETFSLKLSGWQLFNQNFSLDQIDQDWSIMSFCSKWAGDPEITYQDTQSHTEDQMLETMWKLLDEADYVCGHNSKKFDVKKIFSRMVLRGMSRPRPFRQIDTLEIVKRNFGMTSNKLAFLTQNLCKVYVKSDHGQFSGFSLWKECALGNPVAFEELRKYNILDVLSLEELYNILVKWDMKLPVFEVHQDGVADMSQWESCGLVWSNLGKFECFRHKVTGQFRRSRTNLLTKEQRQVLLANIV